MRLKCCIHSGVQDHHCLEGPEPIRTSEISRVTVWKAVDARSSCNLLQHSINLTVLFPRTSALLRYGVLGGEPADAACTRALLFRLDGKFRYMNPLTALESSKRTSSPASPDMEGAAFDDFPNGIFPRKPGPTLQGCDHSDLDPVAEDPSTSWTKQDGRGVRRPQEETEEEMKEEKVDGRLAWMTTADQERKERERISMADIDGVSVYFTQTEIPASPTLLESSCPSSRDSSVERGEQLFNTGGHSYPEGSTHQQKESAIQNGETNSYLFQEGDPYNRRKTSETQSFSRSTRRAEGGPGYDHSKEKRNDSQPEVSRSRASSSPSESDRLKDKIPRGRQERESTSVKVENLKRRGNSSPDTEMSGSDGDREEAGVGKEESGGFDMTPQARGMDTNWKEGREERREVEPSPDLRRHSGGQECTGSYGEVSSYRRTLEKHRDESKQDTCSNEKGPWALTDGPLKRNEAWLEKRRSRIENLAARGSLTMGARGLRPSTDTVRRIRPEKYDQVLLLGNSEYRPKVRAAKALLEKPDTSLGSLVHSFSLDLMGLLPGLCRAMTHVSRGMSILLRRGPRLIRQANHTIDAILLQLLLIVRPQKAIHPSKFLRQRKKPCKGQGSGQHSAVCLRRPLPVLLLRPLETNLIPLQKVSPLVCFLSGEHLPSSGKMLTPVVYGFFFTFSDLPS